VFCAGLNYEAHAEESDSAVPERPLIFMKLHRTLVGHEEPISYQTRVTEEIDYEAELAAVVGERARHVSPEDALDHVAGYTMLNDTSARDLQLSLKVGDDEMLDWFSGKAMQRTTPVGPYVVVDEIDDPQDLSIASRVNDETMQDDNTGMMIRSVADLVSFVSLACGARARRRHRDGDSRGRQDVPGHPALPRRHRRGRGRGHRNARQHGRRSGVAGRAVVTASARRRAHLDGGHHDVEPDLFGGDPSPSTSNAIPWSTLVRMIGRPIVTLTPETADSPVNPGISMGMWPWSW